MIQTRPRGFVGSRGFRESTTKFLILFKDIELEQLQLRRKILANSSLPAILFRMSNRAPQTSRTEQQDFLGVPLDTETIPQDRLNIDNKERCNLFPWNGQFSPQLVEQLLLANARPGSFVLDPFLGSGTVLYEAGLLGMPAFGSEINPAAFKMADVYSLINVSAVRRRRALGSVSDSLEDLAVDSAPLFSKSRARPEILLHEALVLESKAADDQFVKKLLEALIVLLNVGERELDQRKIMLTWEKVREIVSSLPVSEAPIELANCDARSLPLASERVDIVLTSPPYINVFNYHQQYRKSVESLGWDLLKVARSEIGSNRKHRQNRFLTVTQYCLDMLTVLGELRRVCKPNAKVIIVVGRESNVRKTVFFNGEIMAALAVRCGGYKIRSRQERVFQNRFGKMIFEDILHFSLGPFDEASLISPAELAREVLEAALRRAPAESESDLRDALERIPEIAPSPLYRPAAAHTQVSARRVV